MSQITRCPACSTLFKVVSDQLKVAQGWVRCGQCGEVFVASLHWVNADGQAVAASPTGDEPPTPALEQSGAMPQVPTDALPETAMDAVTQTPRSSIQVSLDPVPEVLPAPLAEAPSPVEENGIYDAGQAENLVEHAAEQVPEQALAQASIPVPDEAAVVGSPPANESPPPPGHQIVDDPVLTAHAYGTPVSSDADARLDDGGAPVAAVDTGSTSAPAPEFGFLHELDQAPGAPEEVSFVRDARRKAFWKRPLVRACLGALFVLLLAALGLQWLVRQKDALAAQEPRLTPLLQAICRPLNCEIRPLRRIESVVIDSSSFSKTGPNAYRLGFVLKNTGAAAVEIPAMEVSLTDNQDQALVRKVLMPAQFGVTATLLQGYSELAAAVSLKVSSDGAQAAADPANTHPLPIAGYRILAFYP